MSTGPGVGGGQQPEEIGTAEAGSRVTGRVQTLPYLGRSLRQVAPLGHGPAAHHEGEGVEVRRLAFRWWRRTIRSSSIWGPTAAGA
jgi:hypothetical protein